MTPINVKISNVREIALLSKKSIAELRKLNPHGAFYNDKLTKYQLIYQIVFLRDAPNE